MKNKPEICPLMSTADKKVECTEACKLYKDNPQFHDCAFNRIVEALVDLSETIFDKPEND